MKKIQTRWMECDPLNNNPGDFTLISDLPKVTKTWFMPVKCSWVHVNSQVALNIFLTHSVDCHFSLEATVYWSKYISHINVVVMYCRVWAQTEDAMLNTVAAPHSRTQGQVNYSLPLILHGHLNGKHFSVALVLYSSISDLNWNAEISHSRH